MKPGFKSCAALLIFLALIAMPAVSRAQDSPPYLIAFGDSLSDTGNDLIATIGMGLLPIPPPQMYYQGRFSNGPVTFEYLWAMLNQGALPFAIPSLASASIAPGATSFAFGGSGSGLVTVTPGGFGIPGLKGQVAMFQAALAGQPAPANALYAVWTGPNDYPADPGRPFLDPAVVVGNIADAVRTLYGLGARLILVVNLPDLGVQPLVPPGSPLSALLTQLSNTHNRLLARAMKRLEPQLKGLQIIHGDITGVVAALPPDFVTTIPLVDVLVPVAPGQIPTSFCLFVDPATCPAVSTFAPTAKFLFWDAHPTTAAHARLAQALFEPVSKALQQAAEDEQ
jgi:phospholipase/lecithinase/hemolysin